jgi:hypothetical protein
MSTGNCDFSIIKIKVFSKDFGQIWFSIQHNGQDWKKGLSCNKLAVWRAKAWHFSGDAVLSKMVVSCMG